MKKQTKAAPRATELHLASDAVHALNLKFNEAKDEYELAQADYSAASLAYNKALARCETADAYVASARKALSLELERMKAFAQDLIGKVNAG